MSMTVCSVKRLPNDFVEVIFATAKYKLRTVCYDSVVCTHALTLRPNTKLTIWITVKSVENGIYWNHKVYLMHFEKPRNKSAFMPIKKENNNLTSQRGLEFENE